MTVPRVELSPEALEHVRTIDHWWGLNRTSAPRDLIFIHAVWHAMRGHGPRL